MFDWFGLVGMFDRNGFFAVPNIHAGAHFHPKAAYTNTSSDTDSQARAYTLRHRH